MVLQANIIRVELHSSERGKKNDDDTLGLSFIYIQPEHK